MTAIAFDGRFLVCDSRLSDGADNLSTVKIFKLPDGRYFGGAGHAGYIGRVLEWLGSGSKPKDRPDCARYESAEFSGLLIDDGCCFLLDTYLAPIPITGKVASVGSGASHVLTLMTVGYSAHEAMEAVIRHQLADGVGGEIHVLDTKRKGRK